MLFPLLDELIIVKHTRFSFLFNYSYFSPSAMRLFYIEHEVGFYSLLILKHRENIDSKCYILFGAESQK